MATGRPPKSQRSEFGKKLASARLRLHLTQTQVASRIGVSQQAYAGWERRTLAMKPEHIARAAEVLSLALEDLLGVNRSKNKPELPPGRDGELFAELGKLPPRERERILDVLEDLLSAAESRKRPHPQRGS